MGVAAGPAGPAMAVPLFWLVLSLIAANISSVVRRATNIKPLGDAPGLACRRATPSPVSCLAAASRSHAFSISYAPLRAERALIALSPYEKVWLRLREACVPAPAPRAS